MLVILFAARSSLADHYHVPTGSMEYTIMTGDRVLIDKTAFGLRVPFTPIEITQGGEPGRGDVVIFDSPADGRRLIKRVVAVGGDTITLENGLASINGEAGELFATSVAQLNLESGGGPPIAALTIPHGYLLTLGDHRGNSFDSRYFGLVEASSVYGRALGVYYRRNTGLTWQAL